MSDFKKEFKNFMNDIEKNVTNPKDLEYIKGRVAELFGVVLDEIEEITNYKEEKMNLLMQNQHDLQMKLDDVQKKISNMENDFYMDDEEFDMEIVCPYCNKEFCIDLDESQTEVICPECNNTIELDWSGNPDDDDM